MTGAKSEMVVVAGWRLLAYEDGGLMECLRGRIEIL